MNIVTKLLNAKEVSDALGVSVGTLAVWRCTRRYPLAYIKCGRSVRYSLAAVEEFLRSRTQGQAIE